MTTVKVCDTCKTVIASDIPESEMTVTMDAANVHVVLELDREYDWCSNCAAKAFNKAGIAINARYKQIRKEEKTRG